MKRLCILMSVFLLSCSSDEGVEPNIEELVGVWENSNEIATEEYSELEDGNYEFVLQYKFLSDFSFESFSFIRNIENDSIIGYRSSFKGHFSTEANRMSLNYDHYNSNIDASELADLDELILIEEDVDWGFNYFIEQNELLFDFDPCGPYENCIGELNLERVN